MDQGKIFLCKPNGQASAAQDTPECQPAFVKLGRSPDHRGLVRVERNPLVMRAFAYVGPKIAAPAGIANVNMDPASDALLQHPSFASCHLVTPEEDKDTPELELQPGQRMGWWEHNDADDRCHMTAMVRGAVCDEPTLIMLDTGATTSIVGLDFARKSGLKLKHGEQLTVNGMGGTKTKITARARVKITLGLRVVYAMDVWVGNIGEGVNCLLGMNFMYAAGVRLSPWEGAIELPDEERILLVGGPTQPSQGNEHTIQPAPGQAKWLAPGERSVIPIPAALQKRVEQGAQLWLSRGECWVTQVVSRGKQRRPVGIEVVNISQSKEARIPHYVSVATVVDAGHLPRTRRPYVRPGSLRYQEWTQLVYENTHSPEWLGRLAAEEPAQDEWKSPGAKVSPKRILLRSNEIRELSPSRERPEVPAAFVGLPETAGAQEYTESSPESCIPRGSPPESSDEVEPSGEADDSRAMAPTDLLQANMVRVMRVEADDAAEAQEVFYREGEDAILLHEHRDQLAILPDLSDLAPKADIEKADVGTPGETTPAQEEQMHAILRRHRNAFLGEGNALPPAARGVFCDLDVQGAKPIAQRARRVPPQFLQKVYELLKKLLESGLIEFSSSQWASPIVIILKKNGKDIRLCIDYRRVNELLQMDFYPMPLIDELLSNFSAILWLASLDMASGFWAIPLTPRARNISAFICPLGHFQWTRMPFGLKNAPLVYQRVLDNCLWGFVRLPAELEATVDPEVLEHYQVYVSHPEVSSDHGAPPEGAEPLTVFQINRPAPPQMGPVLGRSSYIDDVAFGAASWEELCTMVDELLFRLRYWGISVSLPKSMFGKSEVDFLSHRVGREGIQATPKIAKSVRDLQFPSTLKGVQSFLGSINYYAKFIEGLPQIASVLYELTEEQVRRQENLERAKTAFELLKEKITSTPLLRHPDRSKPFVIIVHANEWAASAVVAQEHDGLLHPVRFTGRVLQGAELNYPAAEKEILGLLRALNVYFTLLVGQALKVYTRYSTLGWLFRSKSLKGRCHQWATLLSPWTLEVVQVTRDLDGLAALLSASITPQEHMDKAVEELVPQKVLQRPAPPVSVEMLDEGYEGWLLTFDGAAKLKTQVGSDGYILWKLPGWKIVAARGDYLSGEGITVNIAEYQGLISGWEMALEKGVQEIVVVGDSRLAIQQSQGVINCHDPKLAAMLVRVRTLLERFESSQLIHVKRTFNSAADHVTTRVLQAEKSLQIVDSMELEVLENLNRLPEQLMKPPQAEEVLSRLRSDLEEPHEALEDVFAVLTRAQRHSPNQVSAEGQDALEEAPEPPIGGSSVLTRDRPAGSLRQPAADPAGENPTVEARWERIRVNQDAEEPLRKLKAYLRGTWEELTQAEARELSKSADRFVLDGQGVLFYVPATTRRRPRTEASRPRLVVPQELRRDLLQQHHEDKQGGHQGILRTYERLRTDFYWRGMYADVENYVKECVDCTTAKGTPRNPGPSPGNLLAAEPFQVVSMDFVLPLPKTAKGNTALLLFQDAFSGYVMCKPMAKTESQDVAEAYEECVFQRFGASPMLRHDRDPRFMSDVFRQFRELLGSRQRATLAYRPQSNGQQERSGQTIVRSVRAYVEEADQSDWDDIVRRLMFCINTSYDSTRRDTPFYLIHGWDARTTVKAMLERVPRGVDVRTAYLWRLKVQREYEYAKAWARDLQEEAKRRRADQQTALWKALSGKFKEGFGIGDAVWLYMPRVRPGLSKKLAHKWHGPFRILEKDADFRYKLQIEGTDYKFYPWVHVSRLKPRVLHESRPQATLQDVPDEFDFDAALLPEDSWEADETAGEFEVEALLDVRTVKKTRNARQMREYLVKWRGYEETEWVPLERLNCGRLLYEFDKTRRSRARFRAMQSADEFGTSGGEPEGSRGRSD